MYTTPYIIAHAVLSVNVSEFLTKKTGFGTFLIDYYCKESEYLTWIGS